MNKFVSLCIFFIFCIISSLFGQEGTIKGFVYDNDNGEPVSYGTLQLQGTQFGAISDHNGSFIISKIPAGEYVLRITMVGFDNFLDTVTVKSGGTLTKRYYISRSPYSLSAIEVTAESYRQIQETRTSVISVSPKEIARMPSIGGQPDFAQYLQILPGVVSTGDQGGQLYIRGGTPVQNLLLMDGMAIFNPFHSIGLFSVFDTDIMSSADVYTGGFGAEFGGRMSSVMDIKTRDGNRKQLSGKVDVNTFGAKILLEGPFIKLKPNRKTTLSYLFTAKGSYLEQSSKIFYPYTNTLPYSYLDFYGKISLNTFNGTKLNFFGFNFDDIMNYSDIATYQWKNWGIGTNFLIIPGEVPTTIEGTVSYSNYHIGLDEKTNSSTLLRESTIHGFTANLKFNYFFGRSVINAGFDLLGYSTFDSQIKNSEDNTSDLGIFVKYKYNLKDILLIEPSFRLQSYFSLGATSPEPRLALKYNITRKIRLKVAGGLYSQNYVSVSSDRDVVNLFNGFLSSPLLANLPLYPGDTKNNTLQKSQHIILGLELDVIPRISLNIEGYFKNFSTIISANRYKMYPDDQNYSEIEDIKKKEFLWEDGFAYGGDITFKYEHKGLYAWVVYSLGWVQRSDGIVEYSPHFDRRHNVNILLSYAFGKRSSWAVDVRWNYGSGFPFTKTKAFYPHYTPGSISDDYISSNETLSFLLSSDLNGGRLPSYHRLDISLKKKFYLGERHTIDVSLSATNVYNQKNIFYINRTTNDIIYQLPFLYNFGLSWSF